MIFMGLTLLWGFIVQNVLMKYILGSKEWLSGLDCNIRFLQPLICEKWLEAVEKGCIGR